MSTTTMNPNGPLIVHPLMPHQLSDEVTKLDDVFTLCHLGVARLEAEQWRLRVEGLVDTPLSLSLSDLQDFKWVEVESIHQCQGSPLEPNTPTRRISNIRWGGVRLSELLARAGPGHGGRYVWSYGADNGTLGGIQCDSYLKDLPIERAIEDVLIATEMNGSPLTAEHGYPARLFVPGYYGTNSVKWLTRIVVAADRPDGLFTTRFYTDPVIGDHGQETGKRKPVWEIAPESVIVSPAPDQSVRAGEEILVWGRAWADGGVSRVEFSGDGGVNWSNTDLAAGAGRRWQRFSVNWRPPRAGRFTLSSRAYNATGECQPSTGRRNAIYEVNVQVS